MSAEAVQRVVFPSDTARGLAAQDEIVAQMELRDFSVRDVFAMRLALEEAITNAIRHGNGNDIDKNVTIRWHFSEDRLTVSIKDEGKGFDPDSIPDPTTDEFLEIPSGRGVMLMRAYVEVVQYNETGNEVTLVRHRNSELPVLDD